MSKFKRGDSLVRKTQLGSEPNFKELPSRLTVVDMASETATVVVLNEDEDGRPKKVFNVETLKDKYQVAALGLEEDDYFIPGGFYV